MLELKPGQEKRTVRDWRQTFNNSMMVMESGLLVHMERRSTESSFIISSLLKYSLNWSM